MRLGHVWYKAIVTRILFSKNVKVSRFTDTTVVSHYTALRIHYQPL